jgi:hypothetical protein
LKPVLAERLIYTRVEAPFSPRQTGGFQTVWRSPGLLPAEVAAVEKTIQCFRAAPGIRRLQFFPVPGGKLALSHASWIAPDPEIVDRNSRDGAFLVHCFLLPREELARLENNPFRLFDADLPLDGPARLIEELGRGTGIAPPLALVPAEKSSFLSGWDAPEAARLLAMIVRADELRRQGRTIAFTGQPVDIEQALRLAVQLAPVTLRPSCTFNTVAEGCPMERGLFWAAGMPRRNPGDLLEVNTRERKVIPISGGRPAQEDLYGIWLEEACVHQGLERVLEHARTVDLFLRAIEGVAIDSDAELRPEALDSFLCLHRQAVAARIRGTLEQHVRRELAEDLAYHVLAGVRHHDISSHLAVTVSGSSQISAVARLAAHWLERQSTPVERWLMELQGLARKGNHPLLLFLASTLGRKVDTKGRDEALGKMTTPEFQRVLQKLLHPVDPVDFVASRHLPILLQHERLGTAREEQIVVLVERILELEEGERLDALTWCLHRVGDAARQRLARKFQKRQVAASFRREIEAALPRGGSKTWRFWV